MSNPKNSLGSRFRKWLHINYDGLFALRERTHSAFRQMMSRLVDFVKPQKARKPKPTYQPQLEGLEVRQMPSTIFFATSTQSVNYNATSATVEVDLSAASSQTITVLYQTYDGTALSSTD